MAQRMDRSGTDLRKAELLYEQRNEPAKAF
jgi:hypothetical protein